jgi:hypothetical protein
MVLVDGDGLIRRRGQWWDLGYRGLLFLAGGNCGEPCQLHTNGISQGSKSGIGSLPLYELLLQGIRALRVMLMNDGRKFWIMKVQTQKGQNTVFQGMTTNLSIVAITQILSLSCTSRALETGFVKIGILDQNQSLNTDQDLEKGGLLWFPSRTVPSA